MKQRLIVTLTPQLIEEMKEKPELIEFPMLEIELRYAETVPLEILPTMPGI
jgi:hypothetical protein